jgi:hypothetical protein
MEYFSSLDADRLPTLTALADDRVLTVQVDADFPHRREPLAVCAEHVNDGTASNALHDFLATECHVPEQGISVVRLCAVCPGSTTLGKCGLRIVQFDANGNPLQR